MPTETGAGLALALDDREVTVREGGQRADHDGRVAVRRSRRAGGAGGVVLDLAVDPTAARERGMAVELSAADVDALVDALESARTGE